MEDGEEEKKCKGIKKNVVKNEITSGLSGLSLRQRTTAQSDEHDIYTERINKTALWADDNKRIICEDGIRTMVYGQYLSKNTKNIGCSNDTKWSSKTSACVRTKRYWDESTKDKDLIPANPFKTS